MSQRSSERLSPESRKQAVISGAELVGVLIGRYGATPEGLQALSASCRRQVASDETKDASDERFYALFSRLAHGQAALVAEGLALGLVRGEALRQVDQDNEEAIRTGGEAAARACGL